jgi:hypothetical protein
MQRVIAARDAGRRVMVTTRTRHPVTGATKVTTVAGKIVGPVLSELTLRWREHEAEPGHAAVGAQWRAVRTEHIPLVDIVAFRVLTMASAADPLWSVGGYPTWRPPIPAEQ